MSYYSLINHPDQSLWPYHLNYKFKLLNLLFKFNIDLIKDIKDRLLKDINLRY